MCDKELLVSYLYDELQGPERKAFQHHLVSCRECQQEVHALRATQSHLESWSVPAPAPGLRLPGGAAVAPSRWLRVSPAWGLAAAAVLVLAVASAVANVEITTGADGLTVRTGWGREAPASAGVVEAASRQDLEALQARLLELEATLAARETPSAVAAPVSLPSNGGVLAADILNSPELARRVRQWISESEQRQQQVLASRLVQAMREVQAEHSTDLVRLEQAINRSQGLWDDEIFRTREEMKQIYRVVNAQQR